jgi:hypothetical protein
VKLSKKPLYLIIIFSLIVILTSTVYAAFESINVEPGKEITRTVDLATGDRTSITVKVSGPDPSTIHFYLVLPNGTTDDRGDLSHCELSFSTDVKGECQLHFDNVNSSNAQLVILNYEVRDSTDDVSIDSHNCSFAIRGGWLRCDGEIWITISRIRNYPIDVNVTISF